MRPAGRAARAAYGRVPDAAHEQNLGHAGPGPMRVGSAAAKYRGLEEKRWRTVPRRGNGASGGGVPARACSRSAARVAGGAATRHGGIVPCGAFGVLCRGPCGVRPEPGAGPAFRFVLVSVLRGPCPRLSVLSGGWEPAGTDIQRTASLRPNYSVLFEQVRGNMEVQAGAYCKSVLKNRQLSLRWFEHNTCHHMLKRPLGCGNAARRAVSFLSRSGGQASRS
jgi:hypothetical protein